MKNIGVHVGYTVLQGRVSKVVRTGVQMCYCPAPPPFYVMAVFPVTRVVRVLCMGMEIPYCAVACMCVGVADECAHLRLTAPCSASTKRCVFLKMPKRRDCAKSVSASSNDLNRR